MVPDRKINRESGENPERSRHCESEFSARNVTAAGGAARQSESHAGRYPSAVGRRRKMRTLSQETCLCETEIVILAEDEKRLW